MEGINKSVLQGKERIKFIKATIKKRKEAPEHYENNAIRIRLKNKIKKLSILKVKI